LRGVFVGILVTILIQSSSGTTVMTVSFVNAALMSLNQAIGIIMGANIGTTVTAQIIAFKIKDFSLPFIALGVALSLFGKSKKQRYAGNGLVGFGLLFMGMQTMENATAFLSTRQEFFLALGKHPIWGVLAGMFVTMIVQSSAATIGLTMAMASQGLLGLDAALPIILGDNIGTSVTAQLASLTGSVYARRAAWAHTLYNVFGVCVIWIIRPYFVWIVESITFSINPNAGLGTLIANAHTLFNVCSAVIFLPLTKYYVRFLEWIIKDKKSESGDSEDPAAVLDKLLLDTPVAAIRASKKSMASGTKIAKTMTEISLNMICDQDFSKT
jgi:phosphate:Na+ symporter